MFVLDCFRKSFSCSKASSDSKMPPLPVVEQAIDVDVGAKERHLSSVVLQ